MVLWAPLHRAGAALLPSGRSLARPLQGGGLYRQAFALLASAALFGLPAHAKEGDTFRPFVSYTRYYDSNLFRLAEDETTFVVENGSPVVISEDNASDQYSVLSAGLNVDWQPGRQRVQASATKNLVRFSRYTSLDYDGSDYQARWNWRLGNHLSGLIGVTESVTQSSFSDLTNNGLEAVNNTVTRENRFANAEWQFHPRWNVGVGAAAASSTNSTTTRAPLDYEDASVSATLGYTTPKGSKLRGQFRQVDGEYPNRLPSSVVDRTYTQSEFNLLGDWNMTGKLTTRARIGYVKRENDTLAQRDFSGLAGRLSADYSPTGKTMVTWALYREIANSNDLNATYQINSGSSLGAVWLATSKITLRANAAFENRSFEGDTGLVIPGLVQRDEDTLSGSLSLSYAPVRMATIDLGLQAGRRDSNIVVNDYKFRSVFVSVRADF
jgi:exopolysaccharide biosynthesis operon protein EpsL